MDTSYDGGGRRIAKGGLLPPPAAPGILPFPPAPLVEAAPSPAAGFNRFTNESSDGVSSSRPRLLAAPIIWTPTVVVEDDAAAAVAAALGEGPVPAWP